VETRNAAERECGDGALQLGEVCDPALASADSCTSLGQGAGSLGCSDTCTPDTSQCEAASCGRVGPARLRVGGLGRSGRGNLVLEQIESDGRSFDPIAEGVELSLRDSAGLVWSGQIPAGSDGWTEKGDGSLEWQRNGNGKDGLRRFRLGAGGAGASAEIRSAALAGLGCAAVASAVLRIADDCWSGDLACDPKLAGPGAHCKRAIEIPPPWTPPPPPPDEDPDGPGPSCS
jgi:hypothetical protein